MVNNDIIKNLIRRFNQPLDDFYNRRIVFWNDYESEFSDIIDTVVIDKAAVATIEEVYA